MSALTCPSCGASVGVADVVDGPFSCGSCGAGLTLNTGYFRVLGFAALVVAALVSYAFGARGDALFAWTALAWLPARVVIELVNFRIFPPDLELTGEFRAVLHQPVGRDEPASIYQKDVDIVSKGTTGVPAGGDFLRRAEHATLEGTVIWAGAATLVLWLVWNAASPLIRHVLPVFFFERHGPHGFPVTLRIEEESLGIVNGSSETWNCDLAVGVAAVYHASVSLAPGASRYLLFVSFRGTQGSPDAAAGWRAAYDRIHITCREPSGRTHYTRF